MFHKNTQMYFADKSQFKHKEETMATPIIQHDWSKPYMMEYWIGYKFIGYVPFVERDRVTFGYNGIQDHIAEQNIKVGKKTIKEGTEYRTILYPMQKGKIKLEW